MYVLSFFVFTFSLLGGCTLSYQKLASKPVAQVNQRILTTKDFSTQLARRLKNYDGLQAKDPTNIARNKDEVLKNFIIHSLTLDWAESQNILISESDLQIESKKLRANYPDDLSFRRSLAEDNMSYSEWEESLKYYLTEKAVIQKISEKIPPPTESEITIYYESQKQKYKRAESIFIRQIVVDMESKAEFIKNELKTKNFADLAKNYSIAPEAKEGGAIGWIEKGSVDFFDPLFKVSLNSIQVFQSPFGYHVARVEQKKGASFLPIADVRRMIVSELTAQKSQAHYLAWLDGQIKSSKIFKDLELVRSLKVDTQLEK